MCEPSVEDVLHYGRLILEADPFKDCAPRAKDKAFCALFRCGPAVVLVLWIKLSDADLTPENGTLAHMLWAMMYAKQYGNGQQVLQFNCIFGTLYCALLFSSYFVSNYSCITEWKN